MSKNAWERRDFLKSLLAGTPLLAWDWNAFSRGSRARRLRHHAAGGLPADPGFGLTVYDNLYPGCSPKGKNILNIIATQDFDYWKKFETDYFYGNKDADTKEKMRLDVPGRGVRRLHPQRPRLFRPGHGGLEKLRGRDPR
jgi:hypothetical protein